MDRPWFTDNNFTSLEIRQNRSLADHTVVRSVTITDRGYIGKLAGRIEQIPADGDMMVSFAGAAEHIELGCCWTLAISYFAILVAASTTWRR
jgi:hypothetical protein